MKKILILNILMLLIILLGGGGFAYYLYQTNTYISTDDAQVTGDIVPISSRIPGNLTVWNVHSGDTEKAGDSLGTVMGANNAQETVQAPINGTIIKNSAVENQSVGMGQPLALEVDLNKLFIVANIEETHLNDLKTGQTVDVWVDAFSDVKLQGIITQIGFATNSTFSLLPTTSTSGTYTKVVQRVPVKIELSSYNGNLLVPGMNATIRIHK